MLALTRRIGEEIVIGDPQSPMGVIRVVSVHGDKVRLSFDFPRDVKINRRELAELKARQGPRPNGDENAPNPPSAPPRPTDSHPPAGADPNRESS